MKKIGQNTGNKRNGFFELVALLMMLVLIGIMVLKGMIIYRAWTMSEEAARKEAGLEPVATPVEEIKSFFSEETTEKTKEQEIEELEAKLRELRQNSEKSAE